MISQTSTRFSPDIIVTLGPASSDTETIINLCMYTDRFRLNSSHMTVNELHLWLEKLKKLHETTGFRSVTVDLQGAKMRIGEYQQVETLPDTVLIVNDKSSTSPDVIPVPHSRLFDHVLPGEELSLNDDKVRLKIQKKTKDQLTARIIRNGPLSSNKGINRKAHPVPFHEVSTKDKEICQLCSHYDFTELAMSFVHNGSELSQLKSLSSRILVAKIERPESFIHLENIATIADEIWLCRGDLGAQAGIAHLRDLQNQFEEFALAHAQTANFHLAGQVFEHLTHFSVPTRSEVVHFGNALHRGYKGIVLSDETAIGVNPVNAVRYIRNLH